MLRAACSLLLAVALAPSIARAQTHPNEPRIIVVPVPGENVPDAGQPVAAPPPTPPPEPIIEAPPPQPPPAPPPAEPKPDTKLQAQPDLPTLAPPLEPTVPVDPNLDPASISSPPSAMLDGHPREGSFLSGPGSITFLMHHTLMGSFGLLSTQMVPRIAQNIGDKQRTANLCTTDTLMPCYDPTGPDARIAYLVGGLLGAGLGFTSAAFWQFYNWMSINTATFTIVNSIFGAAFGIGITSAITTDPTAISWTGFIAALAGAWITAIVGGGDMKWNKGLLITSGGAWAAIYTALILGMVASNGQDVGVRGGFSALLIMPALGATALALAGLKFSPSSEQILRADFFGAGIGLVVYLISSLLVPGGFIPSATVPAFRSAVPYVLTAVGAAGAKVVVSLLWADTVNPPPPPGAARNEFYRDPALDQPYSRVWW